MVDVKQIVIKTIAPKPANDFIKRHHYSGIIAPTSTLHLGCFWEDRLHGVMSFGYPICKKNVIKLVKNTRWNNFIELNRMAFDNNLPRNSESRCIAIAMKLIKRNYPHIKWVLSFADATQCGDGTIYRASGFYLTGITENKTIYETPGGFRFADIGLRNTSNKLKLKVGYKDGEKFSSFKKRSGCKAIGGFQLRYIYLIDKTCEITVPILPFSKIDEMGAGMYKGQKRNLCNGSSERERFAPSEKVAV